MDLEKENKELKKSLKKEQKITSERIAKLEDLVKTIFEKQQSNNEDIK